MILKFPRTCAKVASWLGVLKFGPRGPIPSLIRYLVFGTPSHSLRDAAADVTNAMPVINEEEDLSTIAEPDINVEDSAVDQKTVEGLKVTFARLLNLLQHCDFQPPTDMAEAEQVIEIAVELGCLPNWIQRCARSMERHLDVQNCLRCYSFAVRKDVPLLQEASATYILQNFMTVYKQKEFLDLTVDQVSWFLRNDELNVTSEEDVFAAMVFWIIADRENRRHHVEELVHNVRLQNCDLRFLRGLEVHYLLWENENFKDRLRFTISDIEAGLPGFRLIAERLRRKPRFDPTSFE